MVTIKKKKKNAAMHAGGHKCVLYAGMKHVTIVVVYMLNVDVCEYINDTKYVLNKKLTITVSQTSTFSIRSATTVLQVTYFHIG